MRDENPGLAGESANALAWRDGVALLEKALAGGGNFAFETTLGGGTITDMLIDGAKAGAEIFMVYVGLETAEQNIRRVAARVTHGGHDIPEEMIRKRFESSPRNLVRLMPYLAALDLYDNSADGDPEAGGTPEPVLLLKMQDGKAIFRARKNVPGWALPILAAARKGRAARRA